MAHTKNVLMMYGEALVVAKATPDMIKAIQAITERSCTTSICNNNQQ